MSEEVKKWSAEFETLDQANDGKLEIQELKKSLQDRYGATIPDRDIVKIFSDLDKSGDGRITKDEFVFVMCKTNRKKVFEETFDKYDTDGSGALSKEELINLCRDIGIPDRVVEETTRKCDKDCDGKIQKDEFMNNM